VWFPNPSNGTLISSANLSSNSPNYATITGNGTAGHAGTSITINGGSVTSAHSGAIYHPQTGTLTINGGTVSGYEAGIAMKSGTLTVAGGSVICTGPDSTPTTGYSNGVNASGAAIQIESSADYVGNVVVNVTGGTVKSNNGAAIYEYNAGNNSVTPTTDTTVDSVSISGGNVTGKIQISSELAADDSVAVSGGTFTGDVSEYVESGYVYLNGTVKKTTSVGNTTVVDAKTLSVVDALGAEVDVSGITSIVKVAATTNKTTVDGKTTTTVVPAWYQLSDGTNSATFVECDKTSAEFMFTFKGVGSVYVRGMAVPAAFDATPVTLYTAPLKATCDYVGQDNDVYVVANGKYYATDSTVVPGAEQYALLSNGKMVVYYGEATAKAHNWAQATVESWSDKTYATATSVKCPDCKSVIKVYTVPGVFDGKTYLQIPTGVAAGYYYVKGAVTTVVPGTVVTPSTDKTVTSAETFDAGIAMYVGMSVMAAAGSAVVIGKKKD